MSDDTSAVSQAHISDEGVPDGTPAPDNDADNAAVGNEAAKYRRRLRETEAERDALTQRVESMQRGEVERLAASKLADPQDVWRDGATMADVLGDDGNIDTTKVEGLVNGLIETHAHWAAATPSVPRPSSLKSGASKAEPPKQASWANAIRHPERELQ